MKKKEVMTRLAGMMLAGMMLLTAAPLTTFADEAGEWREENGNFYWYEYGVKQGTEGRGKEIYDPASDAWYWLDAIDGGKKATSKDVYQESLAGEWGDATNEAGEKTGKWVRYDADGHMVKGWQTNDAGTYYFDPVYGTMAKGNATIDGTSYYFDLTTGILQSGAPVENGWWSEDGRDYWYENGVRQGYDPNNADYRGKEIYDPASDAWYWLDNVQQGAKAVSKDVYQESLAGTWGETTNEAGEKTGKWVRYDANGHMVKGWNDQNGNNYYFDPVYGTMAKGLATIDGATYYFDPAVGTMARNTTVTVGNTTYTFGEDGRATAGQEANRVYKKSKKIYYYEDGSSYVMEEAEYDEHDNKTKYIGYNEDGSISSQGAYEYEYNEHGNETKCISYNADGSIRNQTACDYEYNERGNVTKVIYCDKDGAATGATDIYEYDEYGKVTKELSLYNNTMCGSFWNGETEGWSSSYEYENTYDEHGNLVEVRARNYDRNVYNESGELKWNGYNPCIYLTYDESGKLVEERITGYLSSRVWGESQGWDDYRYQYDSEGRMIKKSVYSVGNSKLRSVTEYYYE